MTSKAFCLDSACLFSGLKSFSVNHCLVTDFLEDLLLAGNMKDAVTSMKQRPIQQGYRAVGGVLFLLCGAEN